MELRISPASALCDQPLQISVNGAEPFESIRISASTRLPWAESVLYQSSAWFTADADGKIDLSRQKPDSGSYDYADGMGLIESFTSADPKAMEKIARNIRVERGYAIEFEAESKTGARVVARAERQLMADGLRRRKITEPFTGEFFYTEEEDREFILFLGGSGSNLGVNSVLCAALASHGFNVLSLPYFGEPGLPAQLSAIPLEYFERVFAWLSEQPLTRGKAVQIFGISKGAELALLLASRYARVARVAALAPHAYCFQGIAFKNESSWTYQGQSLPYIRLKTRWLLANMVECFIKNTPFGYTHTYRKGLRLARNKAEARIKIENAQADLLLFTTRDNNMWNSYDGCLEIMETLRANAYPREYDLVVYEDAGEPYFVPYVIPAGESSMRIAPRLRLAMGGSMKGNAHAQADSWQKTVEFFKRPIDSIPH